jgi:hypothetical protein
MSGEVLARIKAAVSHNHLRSSEFFDDFDPLRKGYISKGQFERLVQTSVLISYLLPGQLE